MKANLMTLRTERWLLLASGLALTAVTSYALGQATFKPSVIAGWAMVEPDGRTYRYKNLTGNGKTGTGAYQISFNRNITGCTYSATPRAFGNPELLAHVDPMPGKPRTVLVVIRRGSGFFTDAGFHLQIFC